MIQYNYYYFGPFLYKATMNNNEIKKIKEICFYYRALCKKLSKNYSSTLGYKNRWKISFK